MEIRKLNFKKREIEVKETYLDADGKMKERTRKILVSTDEVEDMRHKGCDE